AALNLDVAVIGASSAGLFAAERLARAGARVSVFERTDQVAPPRRTLIITPQLNTFLGELPSGIVLHQTTIMEVESRHRQAAIHLNVPDLIVERSALAACLAERATSAGAI